MPENAQREPKTEIRIDVHLEPAADGQDRPEISKQDEHDEGHDIARDRLQAGGHNTDRLQQPVLAIVACKASKEIADAPRDERRCEQQPHRPRQRLADQRRNRGGKGRDRGTKVAGGQAAPKAQILLPQRSIETVKLAQGLAHDFHRTGIGVAELHRGTDCLLDRINRSGVGHEEDDVDADEDDKHELPKPTKKIQGIGLHPRELKRRPRERSGAASFKWVTATIVARPASA